MSIDQEHIDDFMYRTFGYKKPLAKATGSYERAGDADGRIRPPGGAPKAPGAEYERAGDADGRIRPPGGSGGSSATPKKPTPSTTPYSDKVKPKPTSGGEDDLVDSEFGPTRRMEPSRTPYSDKVQSTSNRKQTPYSTTPYSDKVKPKPTSSSQPKPGVAYMDPYGKVEAPEFRPPADGDRYDRGLNMDLGPTIDWGVPVHAYGSPAEAKMAARYRETGVIDNATEHERRMAGVRNVADESAIQYDPRTGKRVSVAPSMTIGQMRREYSNPDAVRLRAYTRDGSDRKGMPT